MAIYALGADQPEIDPDAFVHPATPDRLSSQQIH